MTKYQAQRRCVGITTWYRNGNYGGTLQAVGLLKTLEKLGYKAEFTDFCPREASYKYRILRAMKNLYVAHMYPQSYCSRNKIYKFIAEELPQSPKFYNYHDLKEYANKNYVAAICGSDQIWNSYNGIEPYYFLSYMDGRKIAYAPSIGLNFIKAQFRADFKHYIEMLDALSIREEKGRELILEYTGCHAKVVLDPSMLLTRNEWLNFAMEKDETIDTPPTKQYILCYLLGNEEKYRNFIDRLSDKLALPVYYMSFKRNNIQLQANVISCGVRGFINLINNTNYFLTDSYHGFLFGMALHVKLLGLFRRFSEEDAWCQNSRINQILSYFNMYNHEISGESNINQFLETDCDYNAIDLKMASFRSYSLSYLGHALDNA